MNYKQRSMRLFKHKLYKFFPFPYGRIMDKKLSPFLDFPYYLTIPVILLRIYIKCLDT